MAKRGKERLGIQHRRTTTYPSGTEWRWPASQDALRTVVSDVPTSPTSPTVNGQKPLRSSSWASEASRDTQDTSPDRDPTAGKVAPRPGESYEEWEIRVADETQQAA